MSLKINSVINLMGRIVVYMVNRCVWRVGYLEEGVYFNREHIYFRIFYSLLRY